MGNVSRPRLLDLYCGAGGAAMGYHRAGFDVLGVDVAPQPSYPFPFVQADALEFLRDVLRREPGTIADAVHASPPCQAHVRGLSAVNRSLGRSVRYVDLIAPTRDLLVELGLPYVIENVVGAPLIDPVQLCGSSFGLDLRRHRLFECSFPALVPPCAHGWQTPRFRSLDARLHARGKLASVVGVHGHLNYAGERELRERAMGIDWMAPDELAESIPPAYTECLGEQLRAHVTRLDKPGRLCQYS